MQEDEELGRYVMITWDRYKNSIVPVEEEAGNFVTVRITPYTILTFSRCHVKAVNKDDDPELFI